jgi:sugar phosphate permease
MPDPRQTRQPGSRRSGWSALDRRQRGVLMCTLAANGLVFFDQTAVAVALPAIGRELGADAALLPWVITSYLAALAMFMVVAGRVADRFERRRTFLGGLVLFGVGSVPARGRRGVRSRDGGGLVADAGLDRADVRSFRTRPVSL